MTKISQRYALSFPTPNKEKKKKWRYFQDTEVKETVQFLYLTKWLALYIKETSEKF